MNPRDWFRSHGVGIFPIREGTKVPDTGGRSWKHWTGPVEPEGSYGVELGALVVVDTDSLKSEAITRAHMLPTPFTVTTGRGTHRYYRAPDLLVPDFLKMFGESIQIKKVGGYVLGPGSIHPSGAIYTASDWSWQWEDLPVLVMPASHDGKPAGVPGVIGAPYVFPARTFSAGERRPELVRFIRHLRNHFPDDPAIVKAMVLEVNEAWCDPPLRDKDWRPDTFDKWFRRAWNLPDRALPEMSL